MKIAYTIAPGRGDTDLLLHRLSQELAAKNIHCCGTVQINTDRTEGPCDMDVKILPTGPTLRISQSLGTASKGCRLDPSALEEAVGLVEAELSRGADLLIINKFGKHEADGRGFRNAIAEAIGRDIPVLVGVNALNLQAFNAFIGGGAQQIDPTLPKILNWCLDAVETTKTAA
jgi:nucleoside-triphosphatase THEP1